MDQKELGSRIKTARELCDRSQTDLGEAIGLSRFAIADIEKGRRKIAVADLLGIAEALQRPLSYFVAPAVPSVVSRRRDSKHSHGSTALLDDELGSFASDLAWLLHTRVVRGKKRSRMHLRVPTSHHDAEQKAQQVREQGGLSASEPVVDLAALAERFGMVTYAVDLGADGPDGAVVEVGESENQLGAAVVNGGVPSGRRRMTLAHELGHWLTGDAYDRRASGDTEQMLNSFAIHLLAPRAGVAAVWNANAKVNARDRAIRVAATFRVSWSAALGQLRNVGIIDWDDFRRLEEPTPSKGEFARLGHALPGEGRCPSLSPGLTAGILTAYARRDLTQERTLELLRGTLGEEDLPAQEDTTTAELEAAFTGHEA